MKVRIVIVLVFLILGGLAVYDYLGDDSTNARGLHEMELLAPDVHVPPCYPKHPRAKLMAAAVWADKGTPDPSLDDRRRRMALQHDCIRGANSRANVERLAELLKDQSVPLFQGVIEGCKVDARADVSPPACFALDGLAKVSSPASTAALEKVFKDGTVAKEVYVGALYRLMQVPGWRTNAQLAEMVPAEKRWEAKELLIEHVRAVRDPGAKAALQKASDQETDQEEKGKLVAAALEIDNPGRCVAEDLGAGNKDGTCHYFCKDQDARPHLPKVEGKCPMVRDLPAPGDAGAPAAAGGAADAGAPAAPAAK